jgi:hypothetical protein
MKFIGQYIQHFIARFRNDVYLEDIDTGTIASGGNLGLDSNNKIVKNTVGGGGATDLTSDVTGILPVANGGTGQNSLGSVNISDLNNDSGFTTNTGDITSVAISEGSNTRTVSSGDATINFVQGEGIDVASAALGGNTVQLTISGEDASTSNKGVASFSSDNFAASSGAISIKSGGVDLTDEVTGTLPEGNGGTGVTDVKTIVTRQAYSANFLDDLGTTKHYLPIVDSPNEQTTVYRHEVAMTAPCDGRIASVTVRFENLNTHSGDANVTMGVESRVAGLSYAGTWTVEETETVAIPDTADHDTVHFHFANAKHFDSAELFAVSIQSDTDITGTNERFWVTVVVEWDWSTYLGTGGTSAIYSSTP